MKKTNREFARALIIETSRTPLALRCADEDLNYWGEYYLAHRLRDRGVLFEFFMQAPREIAEAFEQRELGHIPDHELVFLRKQAD